MKRIIALILSLCMTFGMIVSVSASSPFVKRLNLVRLIRSMFSVEEDSYGIGELNDGVLTVYVDTDGSKVADGTQKNPFPTIEAARDAVRRLDKSKLHGIEVIIAGGTYTVENTIVFNEEDSGSESCPIIYQGEDGAILNGGISFDHTEFEKASGDTLMLFPEDVRDKLYMYDMKKLGYSADDIAKMLTVGKYYNEIGIIYINGKQMDLARYPNADEGWIEIEGGHFLDANGNETPYTDNDNVDKELQAHQTIIEYGDEHMERVLSWKNRDDLFVYGRYRFIWCHDETEVTSLYEDRDEMLVPYAGGYAPREGGLFYFYNIPEELDVPGEYYVDDNAILYYYPTEEFETAEFTCPTLDEDIISIRSANWLTFDGLTIESTKQSGFVAKADHLTLKNCRILNSYKNGIKCEGDYITIEGCEIAYIGNHAVQVEGGSEVSLTKSNNLICNNYIHDWCTRGLMNWGIEVSGCGATVCHNEICDSIDLGLCARGPMNTVEYNYIHDTCQFFCDGGTLTTHGNAYGTVVRFNVVMNCGYDTPIDIVGVQGITSDFGSGNEFYGNIIYNTTGHSTSVADGRDTYIHNNLCIKPGRTAHEGICRPIAEDVNANTPTEREVDAHLLSDIWQSTFPELNGINGTFTPDGYKFNPMYIGAPANNTYTNNYLFMDRAFNTWNEEAKHHLGKTTKVEEYFYLFSEIEEISAAKNNLTTYNSKRNNDPITISEALAIANEAVGTVMTEEQLNEVGRIGVDYGIGAMLIE